MPSSWNGKLSICIATYNREAFIVETINSVLPQMTDDVEIVVSDNASTDKTGQVLQELAQRYCRLRYFRQDSNVGIDRNFDRAIELARGEYCWLLGDDDLLKPGAIAAVLNSIQHGYSLILVNGEHKVFSTNEVFGPNFLQIEEDRVYDPEEMDRLFTDMNNALICISCFVVRRSIWMGRNRERYYGSMVIHVGVMLQAPLTEPALAIAQRFLTFRLDNPHSWQPEFFEIFWIKWPSVVWSLAISKSVKLSHSSCEPWRRLRYLIPLRAAGEYRWFEYRHWIRPRLKTVGAKLVAVLVLCVPRPLLYGLYRARSLISGSENCLYEALQRISTLPYRGVLLANGGDIGRRPERK